MAREGGAVTGIVRSVVDRFDGGRELAARERRGTGIAGDIDRG